MFGTALPPLSHELVRLIGLVDECRGDWRARLEIEGGADRYAALIHDATVAAIGASTRLAGAALSDARVRSRLADPAPSPLRTHDEMAVDGYAEAHRLAVGPWRERPLTAELIADLHRTAVAQTVRDGWLGGRFAQHGDRVAELAAWETAERASGRLHPVIRIAMVHLGLSTLHPFRVANGRATRLVTALLLRQARYAHCDVAALEAEFERHDRAIGEALRATHDGALLHWLETFAHLLVEQTRAVDAAIARYRAEGPALPDLAARLVALVRERDRVTMGDAVGITGVSRNTLKAHFRHLVERGLMERRGAGRGAFYALPWPRSTLR